MSHRFEIKEIVTQDAAGILFHAWDRETGMPVGLRRFFPFGADGGGLVASERAEYLQTLAHLVGLKLPGLQSVITGDCDPVDGMPFVATEWIEGPSLAELLEEGHFAPAVVIAVLDRALEIGEALSVTLAEEALWVDTLPAMIVLDAGPEQRGYTFRICPFQALAGSNPRRSLLPLVALAEELSGRLLRGVGDPTGHGLGRWVTWLDADPEAITLTEARQALADMTGNPPQPAPTQVIGQVGPVAQAKPPRVPAATGWAARLIWIGVGVVLAAAAGWWLAKQSHKPATKSPLPVAAVFQETNGPGMASPQADPAKPPAEWAIHHQSNPSLP